LPILKKYVILLFTYKKKANSMSLEDSNQDSTVIRTILETIKELDQLNDIDMILDKILFEARRLSRADAGSIFLRKNQELLFNQVQNDTLFGEDGNRAAQYSQLRIPINSKSIVGYVAQTRSLLSIDDVYKLPAELPCSFNSSFDKEFNYRTVSILAIPLYGFNQEIVGVMQLINATDQHNRKIPFSEESQAYLQIFSSHAAMAINRGIMNREIVLRMVRMSQLHDPKETGTHVQRVGAYSAELYREWAKRHNVQPTEFKSMFDRIRLAAMLHDVGKVGIADTILKKPGKLTEEEYHIIKNHTLLGAQLFTNTTSDIDKLSEEIARHHHERWDGKGYPGRINQNNGETVPLKGNDIPLPSRITALADVYDALSSARSYKEAWTEELVFKEIKKCSGTQFDPELVDIFFSIRDVLRAIGQKYS
jgi:response regulator RpfG family c-di-GMP phosphodiesterase